MNLDDFRLLSWNEFSKYCWQLERKITSSRQNFDRIVCVSRGGLVISRILSDLLSLPISNLTIVSYGGIDQAGEPKIVEDINVDIKNEAVLLIDEICDTGSTFKKAVAHLNQKGALLVNSGCPFLKPKSDFTPNFWVRKTQKWLIFPYEIKETVTELSSIWKKEGLEQKKIIENLLKVGFKPDQVYSFIDFK